MIASPWLGRGVILHGVQREEPPDRDKSFLGIRPYWNRAPVQLVGASASRSRKSTAIVTSCGVVAARNVSALRRSRRPPDILMGPADARKSEHPPAPPLPAPAPCRAAA